MAHTSALLPDDRRWLESEIDDLVMDFTSVRSSEVTQDLISRLQLMASEGSGDAQRVLGALAADGVFSLVASRIKHQRGTIRVSSTGKLIDVPARVGARARDERGAQLRAFQQTLWYEMSWDDFTAMIVSRIHHIEQLKDKVTAFQEVLSLREIYPESTTPGQALEMAGIDPSSIDLGSVA